jgi:hypothetical protein
MAQHWRNVRQDGAVGVIWQDPDIVADPADMTAMRDAIERNPDYVHVSIHRLWPASTMRQDWVWAHGLWQQDAPVLSQRLSMIAEWWALGLTYTPAALLDLAVPHMPAWHFGQVDNGLAAIARQHKIPGRAVDGAQPKHLHYYPREDDASWRAGKLSGSR